MGMFRKKPVVIEAIHWDGTNPKEVHDFIGCNVPPFTPYSHPIWAKSGIDIPTLEGHMVASVGDWVIKGINGEFYPCKPDIFEKTYDEVKE